MTVETVAGTRIYISASTPASFTIAGYEAIAYKEIGEITDGGEHGRVYAEVTHNPIATRGTQKFKGSFNEGTKTLQLGLDYNDEGQDIARAALLSDNDYSFRVDYQGGDRDYFQAKVMSFRKATGSVDSIRSATIDLSITTSRTGIGILEDTFVESP